MNKLIVAAVISATCSISQAMPIFKTEVPESKNDISFLTGYAIQVFQHNIELICSPQNVAALINQAMVNTFNDPKNRMLNLYIALEKHMKIEAAKRRLDNTCQSGKIPVDRLFTVESVMALMQSPNPDERFVAQGIIFATHDRVHLAKCNDVSRFENVAAVVEYGSSVLHRASTTGYSNALASTVLGQLFSLPKIDNKCI